MAWTLVALAARAGRALGGRRAFVSTAATGRADALVAAAPDHPDVFARVCARRLEVASPADRKALEAALSELGNDAPVVERAIASGAPLDAVAILAAAWSTLDADAKALVRDPLTRRDAGPVTWSRVTATQVSATTCGAASMAMMLVMGDPLVALWVATGRRGGAYMPPEVLAAEVRTRVLHTVADRWDALQLAIHDAVTRRGLGVAPWPQTYGTPPWRVNNETRFAGLRFRGALVDDSRADEVAALAAHARAALADGIPVPLYVSGDSARGLDSVVPRHVVLLVGVDGDGFLVYEPSSGAVHRHEFLVGGGKSAALGHWNRVAWAVLPRTRRG
ncbi:hypothetical protein LGT39_02370 [Demequina sp. TTPB684]|uniref:hypothetical protein n=1 Tax=unclassified Demequina TaxID=2620311 RepID=UPI001CF57349|nr:MULTISPECIES: hypothetical protein [unclassified Demequina]MCB2411692.1 hypothetical protein [Demequina sp. TTPB684]UPU87270.1 hypothetical protein LGT36_008270 [Demequina sp. TMPB413]